MKTTKPKVKITKIQAMSIINCLINSCYEGMDQTWDCSPKGFSAMIIQLEELLSYIKKGKQ